MINSTPSEPSEAEEEEEYDDEAESSESEGKGKSKDQSFELRESVVGSFLDDTYIGQPHNEVAESEQPTPRRAPSPDLRHVTQRERRSSDQFGKFPWGNYDRTKMSSPITPKQGKSSYQSAQSDSSSSENADASNDSNVASFPAKRALIKLQFGTDIGTNKYRDIREPDFVNDIDFDKYFYTDFFSVDFLSDSGLSTKFNNDRSDN
ncbi:unnamed protein product [Caenorhabditis auriculariae]|uniref:Uncharacterized protein n=1 Tax=Caenorhabditis auriculariae TaxID=2777116 RepID=A0A8S1HM39_9PELO|nr:unnamed protein product [Caenorhabditis auriculariae]